MRDRRAILKLTAAVPVVGIASTIPALADGNSDWVKFASPELVPFGIRHYAPLMYKWLLANGVEILPVDQSTMQEGAKVGGKSIGGAQWQQHHPVNYLPSGLPIEPLHGEIISNHIISLAKEIKGITNKVRFGFLWMPPHGKGIVHGRYHNYFDVTLREISFYDPRTDEVRTRVDALFCDGHAEA